MRRRTPKIPLRLYQQIEKEHGKKAVFLYATIYVGSMLISLFIFFHFFA